MKKNFFIFALMSIFYQKRLRRIISYDHQTEFTKLRILQENEFEEKLRFIEYHEYDKVITKSRFPHIDILELYPFSIKNHTNIIETHTLKNSSFNISPSFVDNPIDAIKKQCAIKLAQELVNNGIINTTIENNKIQMFVNVYQ